MDQKKQMLFIGPSQITRASKTTLQLLLGSKNLGPESTTDGMHYFLSAAHLLSKMHCAMIGA